MGLNGKDSATVRLTGLLIFVNVIGIVVSICCDGERDLILGGGKCADGTDGTPCCGYGSCNIFCCNCDGGCRGGGYTAPPGNNSSVDKGAFVKMDRNGDGFVDKEEARVYVLTNVYMNHTEKMVGFEDGFKKLDKLGKGKLILHDID